MGCWVVLGGKNERTKRKKKRKKKKLQQQFLKLNSFLCLQNKETQPSTSSNVDVKFHLNPLQINSLFICDQIASVISCKMFFFLSSFHPRAILLFKEILPFSCNCWTPCLGKTITRERERAAGREREEIFRSRETFFVKSRRIKAGFLGNVCAAENERHALDETFV